MFRRRIEQSSGVWRAFAIEKAGNIGVTEAADLIHRLTWDSQWEVRATAIIALGKFGDARATEALARNAGDIRSGPFILTWLVNPLAAVGRQAGQVKLIRLAQKNGVHQAEPVLESIVLDAWSGKSLVRVSAGEALGALNRPKCVALTRTLLKRWSDTEKTVGVMIAEYARLTELRVDLERLVTASNSEKVRQAARKAIDRLPQ